MIWKIDLAWIAEQMGILPCRTFCECSVGPLEISVAQDFVGKCRNMLLFEPNQALAAKAASVLNAPICRTAIGFTNGMSMMYDNGGSSFLHGTWAPTPPPSNAPSYQIYVSTFDTFDDGSIDVLALDCEGMEWAVLSKMISRPDLMTIEIWDGNPYKDKILHWLKANEYILRFTTGPTTETHLYSRADSTDSRRYL